MRILFNVTESFLKKPWAIPASILLAFIIHYISPEFSESISEFAELYLSLFLLAIIPYVSAYIILSVSDLIPVNRDKLNIKKWFYTYFLLYCIVAGSAMSIAHFMNLGKDLTEQPAVAEFVRNSNVSNLLEVNLDTPLEKENEEGVVHFLVKSLPENLFEALSQGKMIQIIGFSILFGIAIGFIPSNKKAYIHELIDTMAEPFRLIIDMAILCLPIGMVFIMSHYITSIKDPLIVFYLWKFILTIIVCMLALGFVFTLIAARKLKIPYFESFKVFKTSSIIALTTADTLAALPSLQIGLKENTKLKNDSVDLVAPLGVTLFRFGTIFYYSFVTIFIAQMYHIHLSFYEYLVIFIAVYFAAAAEAEAPFATLSFIFMPLGLPILFVTLFMVSIDWLMDPFRSLFTIITNYTGSALVVDEEDDQKTVKK